MPAAHELAARLRDADDNQVLSALTRLPPGPIPDGQAALWARAYRRCGAEVRRSVASICLRRLSLQGRIAFFREHPLFRLQTEVHRWYASRYYQADGAAFLAESRDLLRLREALSPLLRLSSELFAALQAAADALWCTFRRAEAGELYGWILDLDPEASRACFYLGQLHAAAGDEGRALESFDRYLALAPAERPANEHVLNPYDLDLHAYAPSAQEAYTRIAAIYRQRGELDTARRALLRAVGRGPRHHMAPRFQLGQLLIELGDLKGALAQLRQAEAVMPRLGHDPLRFNRGADSSYPEHRELFTAMARDYPMHSGGEHTRERRLIEAYLTIADRLRAAGQLEEALALYGSIGAFEKQTRHRRGQESQPVLEGKLAIAAERYRDWYQVEALSERMLERWPGHEGARRYRDQARRALRRA